MSIHKVTHESFLLNKWTHSMEHKLCNHKFNIVHIPCNWLIVQYLLQLTAHIIINKNLLFLNIPPTSFASWRPSSRIIKLQRHTFMIQYCQRCANTKLIYSTMWYNIAEICKIYNYYGWFTFIYKFVLRLQPNFYVSAVKTKFGSRGWQNARTACQDWLAVGWDYAMGHL